MESPEATVGRSILGRTDVNRYQTISLVILGLGLLTLPVWGSSLVFVATYASLWAVFAVGWDLISGHSGYISFGHSLLSGSAAYATALLIRNVNPEMSLAITIPLSILAAVGAGLVFGLPSLRLEGPYFSLVTFVSVLVTLRFVDIFSEYTNGELGIQSIPVFTYDTTVFYYINLGLVFVVATFAIVISRSNVGRVLIAIREREHTVQEAGINTAKFKLWAFTLSAIVMSVGGVFLAHFYGNVSPANSLALENSVLMIAIATVGGMGTILGPVLAAYVLIVIRDIGLRYWTPFGDDMRFIMFWVIILVFIVTSPDGVLKRIWEWLGRLGGGGED